MVIGIEGDSSRGRVASRPMKTNDLRNNASHVVHYTSPNVDIDFFGIQRENRGDDRDRIVTHSLRN